MNHAIPRRRRAMMQLLRHEAGSDRASSEDLAAASGRVLDRVSQQLSEVIGHAGVEALVLRAVKLQKRDFPFLDEGMLSRDQGERPGDFLRARLQNQESDVIKEASVTLFATIAGLLATVIGERLAWSLLRDAWPETLRSETEFQEAEE
jgi:hypothetical protein